MRKQTKIAAVVSAAALLAIGASMTSFAATGWQEEDGTWVYYNKNEERVTDTWEKSGDNWFYLDDAGEMAVDALIDDDDDYYYVDANGAMVRNQWVAIDNEDAGEDDQPDVWWYYFGANGKAYKNTHESGSIFKKVINGKTYCFDDEGRMQYGWVDKNTGVTVYDDDAFSQDGVDYYFGDENDGAMTVGWREIALTDVNDEEFDDQPGDSYWDEDQVRWFYFKSSGKKQTDKLNKGINGKKYGFDKYGRMIADWYSASASETDKSASRRGTTSDAKAVDTYTDARTFMYYSTPEDGARYGNAWFKVIPGYYLNYGDYDDGTDRWFYADGKGKLYAGQIKSIKGKKYAFDLKGGMISGLAVLRVDKNNNILQYIDSEDNYDTEDAFKKYVATNIKGQDESGDSKLGVYYFSNDPDHDGTMKTGSQKITLDGDTFTFKFAKSGTDKGVGLTKEDDNKYYLGGMLLKASSDDKIVALDTETFETYTITELINDQLGLEKHTIQDTEKAANKTKASVGDTVYNTTDSVTGAEDISGATKGYVIINTSGAVVKSGTKKDGDGIKVLLKDKKIIQIYAD